MAKNLRRWTRVRAPSMAAHLRSQRGRTPCLVENISMGGLFVRTDQLEDVGTEIAVDLVKPGWKKQLSLSARVTSRVDALDGRVSKRMPGMGLQFIQLETAQHDRLRALMVELGAPDEEAELTLPDDALEAELRALGSDSGAATSPGPRPVAKTSQPQAPWEHVQLMEDAIGSAGDGLRAPAPLPLAPALPRAAQPLEISDVEVTLLKTQLRGLVMQLSDVQQQLADRDAEIGRLREQLDGARAALERALRSR
jgi:Tfp pilus assembly protein PilZ